MQETQNRKLAAILFADIEGYTTLMQENEVLAKTQLDKFRQVLTKEVATYNGQIVNFYGDGCLAIFNAPLDAVHCAEKIQQAFQETPLVPVRVGLHSGTVVIEADNVFGDAVNLTSRIESMGISGSVLLSERMQRDLKNQPSIQVQSLGKFEFKNVTEPMEVFALTNEGLAIPKRTELKGKFISSEPKKNKWLFPSLLGILILGIFGYWQWNNANSLDLIETNQHEPFSTPLSKEIREKRVAVLVFDNQTMSEEMEAFGKMISDWVTRGLMETGEANVISAANIQNQIAKAGLGQGANPEFAANTGVDIMLQGRYYLQENRLIIHANIVEIASGEVIHALAPIEGDKGKMIDLLDELTQEVLGYWAVKKTKRFLQNPPKYEAYKKYQETDNNWHANAFAKQHEQLLIEAYQLDTNFYAPLLKLAVLYYNPGVLRSFSKMDSVLHYIESKNPTLTKWEKLRLAAVKELNFLKRAQINEQMYNMDASYDSGNFNAAVNYLFSNRPQKTVALLEGFDTQFRDFEVEYAAREGWLSLAYSLLGKYDKVIEIAENYSFPKMLNGLAFNHLKALLELNRIDEIWPVYEQYMDRGIYDGQGEPAWDGYLLTRLSDVFYIEDKKELLNESVNRLKKLTMENKEDSFYNQNMGRLAFYQGDYEQAVSFWEKQTPTSNASKLYLPSVIGVGLALNGNLEAAEKQLSFLVNYPLSPQDERMERRRIYYKGVLLLALGRKEEAISALKMANEKRLSITVGRRYKNDIFLKPLMKHPEFIELMRPKG